MNLIISLLLLFIATNVHADRSAKIIKYFSTMAIKKHVTNFDFIKKVGLEDTVQPQQTIGKTYLVASKNEFDQILQNVKPGDKILFKDGLYKDTSIYIPPTVKGTATAPIIIGAQNKHKVIFSGYNSILIQGNYIHLDGIKFDKSDHHSIFLKAAKGIQIRNNYFKDSGCRTFLANGDCDLGSLVGHLLKIAGSSRDIVIKNNIFEGTEGISISFSQKKPGVVYNDPAYSSNPQNILIAHNVFKDIPRLRDNGGEAIMVGLGYDNQSDSDNALKAIIEYNHFLRADGDSEIVSFKSNKNIFRNNLVEDCKGHISVRMGKFNTIENNVLLITSGGIRLTGEGSIVKNNTVFVRPGSTFSLALMNGIRNDDPTIITDYFPAKNSRIENNLFLGSKVPIDDISPGTQTPPGTFAFPSGNIIRKNIFQGFIGNNLFEMADKNFLENNKVEGNTFSSQTYKAAELTPQIKSNNKFAKYLFGKIPLHSPPTCHEDNAPHFCKILGK